MLGELGSLVGDEGLEESQETRGKATDRQSVVTSVVTSEAITGDLRGVVEAWPTLSSEVRNRILRLVSDGLN